MDSPTQVEVPSLLPRHPELSLPSRTTSRRLVPPPHARGAPHALPSTRPYPFHPPHLRRSEGQELKLTSSQAAPLTSLRGWGWVGEGRRLAPRRREGTPSPLPGAPSGPPQRARPGSPPPPHPIAAAALSAVPRTPLPAARSGGIHSAGAGARVRGGRSGVSGGVWRWWVGGTRESRSRSDRAGDRRSPPPARSLP